MWQLNKQGGTNDVFTSSSKAKAAIYFHSG